MYTGGDSAEVVVLELLVLGRFVPQQRATSQQQVGTGGIYGFVDKEILLFPTQIRIDLMHGGVEEMTHVGGGAIDGVQRLEQRRLVVESLAGIGDKDGGDAEGVVDHEGRRRGVPGGVATSFEGIADAAVGETGAVGLLLRQQFARELLDDVASRLTGIFDEGVMFLGRALGEWLEPVGVVRGAHVQRPVLHAYSHIVGHFAVERSPVVEHIAERPVGLGREVACHLFSSKNVATVIIGNHAGRRLDGDRLLGEGLLQHFKS